MEFTPTQWRGGVRGWGGILCSMYERAGAAVVPPVCVIRAVLRRRALCARVWVHTTR